MTWAGCVSAVDADLTAAAATLNPVPVVQSGEPPAAPVVPIIAYWWIGERESSLGGHTLGLSMYEQGLMVKIYVPTSTARLAPTSTALEIYLQGAVRAIKAKLWANTHLGGNAVGIEIETVTAGWTDIAGTLVRSAEFPLWIDQGGDDTIAN